MENLGTSSIAAFEAPTGAVSINGLVEVGQTLIADTSALVDPDEIVSSFRYYWLADGLPARNYTSEWDAMAGIMSNSLTLTAADVGKTISVRVGYTDGTGITELVTSSSTVQVTYPEQGTATVLEDGSIAITAAHLGLPIEEGQAGVNSSIIITVLPSAGELRYCGSPVNLGQIVNGGDLNAGCLVFVPSPDAHGIGYASFGFSSRVDGLVSFNVLAVNDTPTGKVSIKGTAETGQTLNAITSTIDDVDGVGEFNYQWLADGVPIANATSSSFHLGRAQLGKAMTVQVSYVDGDGTTETMTSSVTAAVTKI